MIIIDLKIHLVWEYLPSAKTRSGKLIRQFIVAHVEGENSFEKKIKRLLFDDDLVEEEPKNFHR